MAPINLAIIVTVATPLSYNPAGKLELKELTAIRRIGLEITAVHDIQIIVGAYGERPRAAEFGRLPHLQKLAVRVENLNPRIIAIRDVDQTLLVDSDAMRKIELAGTTSFLSP